MMIATVFCKQGGQALRRAPCGLYLRRVLTSYFVRYRRSAGFSSPPDCAFMLTPSVSGISIQFGK